MELEDGTSGWSFRLDTIPAGSFPPSDTLEWRGAGLHKTWVSVDGLV